MVAFVPTMKPLDSDKKVSKEVSAPVEAAPVSYTHLTLPTTSRV